MGHLLVIGAGTMGAGIATVAVQSGLRTVLIDVDQDRLQHAMTRVARTFERAVTAEAMTAADAEGSIERLTVSTDLEGASKGAASAIEAVVEDMTTKRDVLRALSDQLDAEALIATNTSSLSVTELSRSVRHPERFVGMHFFNPVPRMPLCEIVRALFTVDRTVERARSLAGAFGKTAVVVEDVPGFATSRVSALLGNEAFKMLEEGVATAEDIDTAVRLGLNHPMGPLALGDMVGLDVRLAVLEELQRTLGDRFRPTNVHRRLVAAGRLGRKTGHGVFRYDD